MDQANIHPHKGREAAIHGGEMQIWPHKQQVRAGRASHHQGRARVELPQSHGGVALAAPH